MLLFEQIRVQRKDPLVPYAIDRISAGNKRSLRGGITEKFHSFNPELAVPKYGYGFARSHAFGQAAPLGSLFKLVTSYEALKQSYLQKKEEDINPLVFIDDLHRSKQKSEGWNVGFTLSGESVPQLYKGGRLPRSHRKGIGKLDLVDALAVSSNPYFSLVASDIIRDPKDLNRAASSLSFGQKTGIDLPGEIPGNLPGDLECNRTGLYAYAIGHHTLVVTPLQTAVMLSALVNGGNVFKPLILKSMEGVYMHRRPIVEDKRDFEFKKTLSLLGIDFPFFACKERGEEMRADEIESKIRRHIDLPEPVQKVLLKGMYEAVHAPFGTANPHKVRNYASYYSHYLNYRELWDRMIGKTSSAEVTENIDLDFRTGTGLYKHVWFGGVIFEKDCQKYKFSSPELVVIVYLRYGNFGKEAAPLAADMAKKWEEIRKKRESF